MKAFHIMFEVEELKYLSISLNNQLTIHQPNLFKNTALDSSSEELKLCLLELIKDVSIRFLTKYNTTYVNGRKKATIGFTKAEAYAISVCHRYGGFNHFGDYEFSSFYKIIERSNQLLIA